MQKDKLLHMYNHLSDKMTEEINKIENREDFIIAKINRTPNKRTRNMMMSWHNTLVELEKNKESTETKPYYIKKSTKEKLDEIAKANNITSSNDTINYLIKLQDLILSAVFDYIKESENIDVKDTHTYEKFSKYALVYLICLKDSEFYKDVFDRIQVTKAYSSYKGQIRISGKNR